MVRVTFLKKTPEFSRIYRRRRSVADRRLVIYVGRNGDDSIRLGISISKKVGGSVVRNRIKRQLREVFRLNAANLINGHDLVVVVRKGIVGSNYWEIEKSFLYLVRKLGVLEGDIHKKK